MKILSRFVVHQGPEPALFPGLARAANGDLLVGFCTRFDCLPEGAAYLLRSCDEGRSWSEPVPVLRSRKPDGCINLSVGLTTLRDGTVLYPCCDVRMTRKWDQHDADLIILRSADHGRTWSAPAPCFAGVQEPFAYGRILECADGTLLCPIWGKRVQEEAWRSGVIRSRDGGHTWGEYATIAYDPDATCPAPSPDDYHCAGYNETTLLELPDGRLLAVLRQQGVHGGRRELDRAMSADGGRTWTTPTRMNLWGTSPSLHLLSSGFIVLGYRNHLGNPQGLDAPGVGVSLSHDGGLTWSEHSLLEDSQGHRYAHEFEAGYPAFLSLGDGSTLVVFYSYDPALPAERYLAANILSA